MTTPEWGSLYLVFCWLRGVEYITWRPAGTVVFRGGGPGCSAAPPHGESDRGFVLGNAFRLFQDIFVSGTALTGSLDAALLQRRLDLYNESAKPLFRAEGALVIHLFVVVPLVWSTVGIAVAWPYLLAGLLVMHLCVLITFFRAHRHVFESSRGDRWSAAMPFLLAPPMATAAHMALTKPMARGLHPVAAAFPLCDDESFRELALDYVRRAEFPLSDPDPENPSETPAPMRGALRSLAERRLGPIELDAPQRESETARTYCPRCLAEYSDESGTCADCAGVALKGF